MQANSNNDIALTRLAVRGVLFITLAKLFFMVSGYVIHFALPRLLGSPELYGVYGVVISIVNVLDMVVIQGTLQTVSKLVSEDEANAEAVRRKALLVQLALGGGIALSYFLSADLIASMLKDSSLAVYFRLSAVVVLCYSFYAIFIGYLNGKKRFKHQAMFDVSFATMKTVLILGAAGLGLSVLGVIGGFATAALVIVIAAALFVGFRERGQGKASAKRIFFFMLPVMLYTLVLNMLLSVDLWFLKSMTVDALAPAARQIGQGFEALAAPYGSAGGPFREFFSAITERLPELGANAQTGLYTAAQVIARIPYQAILSVTFVVFPLLSRAAFTDDREAARRYIGITFRYSLIIVAGLVSVISSLPYELIAIPYGSQYLAGGQALLPLSWGMMFFALFVIATTMLTGSGRPRMALAIALGVLVLDIILLWLLTPRLGALGAALSTLISMAGGFLIAFGYLYTIYKAAIPRSTLLRVALSAGAVVASGWLLPPMGKLITLGKCLVLGLLYFGILLLLREFKREEWSRLKQVFNKK